MKIIREFVRDLDRRAACNGCPLSWRSEETQATFCAAALTKEPPFPECAEVEPYIADDLPAPAWCPLREGAVTVMAKEDDNQRHDGAEG